MIRHWCPIRTGEKKMCRFREISCHHEHWWKSDGYSAGSRPWDRRGGGGGSSRPLDKIGGAPPQIFGLSLV